jgi:hypothetical protein
VALRFGPFENQSPLFGEESQPQHDVQAYGDVFETWRHAAAMYN